MTQNSVTSDPKLRVSDDLKDTVNYARAFDLVKGEVIRNPEP